MPHGSEKCLCFTGSVTVCGSWLYSRMQRGFGLGKEGSTQTWSLTSLKSTIPTICLLSLKGLYLNLSIKWRWSATYLGKFHSRVSESIPLAEERPVAPVPLGGMVTLRTQTHGARHRKMTAAPPRGTALWHIISLMSKTFCCISDW